MEQEHDLLTVHLRNFVLSPTAFRNFVRLLYSRQYLINRSVGGDTLRIEDAVIQHLRGAPPQSAAECIALVQEWRSKGLIAGFDYTHEGASISYPKNERSSDDVQALMALTERIVKKAANTKAPLPAEKLEPENEKFYMNRWLKQIGFQAQAHRELRHSFLKNLKGDAAYRTEALAKRSRESIAEVRRIRRELLAEDR